MPTSSERRSGSPGGIAPHTTSEDESGRELSRDGIPVPGSLPLQQLGSIGAEDIENLLNELHGDSDDD
jgi:hypothetical protein